MATFALLLETPRSSSKVKFPSASEVAEGDQETRRLERKCVDDDAQKEFECQNLNLRYPYLLCCAASILHKSSQEAKSGPMCLKVA